METRKTESLIPILDTSHYYVDDDMDELMTSIQNVGMLVPIKIRPTNEIFDGKRRWIAASRLGIEEVPVEVIGTTTGRIQSHRPQVVQDDIGIQEDEAAFFDMEDEP